MEICLKDPVMPAKGNKVLMTTVLIFAAAIFAIQFLRVSILGSMVISQGLVLACGLIGAWHYRYNSERDLKIKPIGGYNLLMVFFALICCYPIVAFLNLVSMQFVPNAVQAAASEVYVYGLGPSILLMAVFPAVGEELLMRGIVYRSYRKASPVAAMFLSALIFGMLHMNFNQMPYAVFLGIVMVLLNEAADSMTMSMVLHFLFNGSSTLLNYISSKSISSEEMDEAMAMVSHADPILFIVYGIIAFIMGLLLIVVIRAAYVHNHRTLAMAFAKDPGRSDEETGEEKRKMRIVDPWFIIAVIVLVIIMVRSVL